MQKSKTVTDTIKRLIKKRSFSNEKIKASYQLHYYRDEDGLAEV
jgi:hypothetical protein